jgi:hypothetical protein
MRVALQVILYISLVCVWNYAFAIAVNSHQSPAVRRPSGGTSGRRWAGKSPVQRTEADLPAVDECYSDGQHAYRMSRGGGKVLAHI